MTALILFASFAVLLIVGVPIAIALGTSTMLTLCYLGLPAAVVGQRFFTAIDSSSIMAIPLFVLAGNLMTYGGISKRIVEFASTAVGNIRGSLFYVMVVSCAFFAALSGSAPATVIAIGSMLYPEMIKRKYPAERTAGLLVASGGLGPIIPPSIIMVIYGTLTAGSIGDLFKSGMVVGLMLTAVLIIVCAILSVKENWPVSGNRISMSNLLHGFVKAFFAVLLPIVVLGGIYTGIMTPTESAAVAVAYAFVVGVFIYRELPFSGLFKVLVASGKGSAIVLFIMALSNGFSWLFTVGGISRFMISSINSMHLSAMMFCLIAALLLLFLGVFLEGIATIVLMVPLLWPIAEALGVNVIHFGMIVCLANVIGAMTPPVAVIIFSAASVTGQKMGAISRGLMPYFIGYLVVFFAVVFIPDISTFIN